MQGFFGRVHCETKMLLDFRGLGCRQKAMLNYVSNRESDATKSPILIKTFIRTGEAIKFGQ